MNKVKISLLLCYVTAAFLAGCEPESFTAKQQVCTPAAEKAYVMETAEDVLARMHFMVEKADIEEGIIRTKPLRAAQSFEIWRRDNIGQFNSTEANLHTIRRIAQLGISQESGKTCVSCDVQVQRMSLPERQIGSKGETAAMFTRSKTSLQRLELREEQKEEMAWIDLGRDTHLETEILNRIEKKLSR